VSVGVQPSTHVTQTPGAALLQEHMTKTISLGVTVNSRLGVRVCRMTNGVSTAWRRVSGNVCSLQQSTSLLLQMPSVAGETPASLTTFSCWWYSLARSGTITCQATAKCSASGASGYGPAQH
jgi:hypothetical protein